LQQRTHLPYKKCIVFSTCCLGRTRNCNAKLSQVLQWRALSKWTDI
jgi:hypothetical protein